MSQDFYEFGEVTQGSQQVRERPFLVALSGKIETGLPDPTGLPGNGQGVIFEDAIEHPSPTVGVAACFVNDQNEGSRQCRGLSNQILGCPPASSHNPIYPVGAANVPILYWMMGSGASHTPGKPSTTELYPWLSFLKAESYYLVEPSCKLDPSAATS